MFKKNKLYVLLILIIVVLILKLFYTFFTDERYNLAKGRKNDAEIVEKAVYSVVFDANGGDGLISTQQVLKYDLAVRPIVDPIKDGYIFLGWYSDLSDDTEYDFNTLIMDNITLIAKWEKIDEQDGTFLVKFYSSGSIINLQVVKLGEKILEPTLPMRSGYTFLGWYDGENKYDFGDEVTSNIVLQAKWEKSNQKEELVYYVVTFNSNGDSSVNSQIVESGKTVAVPIQPTRSGYTFLGWYNGESLYNFGSKVTSNITLVAKWKGNNDDKELVYYVVTFDSNGGSGVNSQNIESGKTAVVPTIPVRKWYSFVAWKLNGEIYDFNTPVTNNITLVAEWKVSSVVTLIKGIDLVPNSNNASDMRNNTINLQRAIDLVSESGGGSVQMPAGTFYFSLGGRSNNWLKERYVIKPKNNVHLIGAGTNENNTGELTILKPYFKCDGSGAGSMDMFYFNNYADTGFNNLSTVNINTRRDVNYTNMDGNPSVLKNQTVYLINADFSNFVIDGAEVQGCSYETDGKGFMINLFKDCDWNNVVVKNTDATGFGIDCPINSTINNCVAINCGKNATTNSEGASGFGIGVGYANNEAITISNSLAINNKKFGFFFEHQARFNSTAYLATKSDGFIVKDSIAGGNMYDFGGLKAYDVTYNNVKSISGKSLYLGSDNLNISKVNITIRSNNVYPVYFSMYSKNISLINSNFSSNVNDISTSNILPYISEINWAINNGIIPVNNSTAFNPYGNVNRFDAVSALYKYNHMPGTITIKTTAVERNDNKSSIRNIGFTDLDDSLYVNDLYNVIWAYDNGIISKDNKFRPADNVTRAEFITMLYRMSGLPVVSGTLPFSDVNENSWYYNAVMWGYQEGIINGVTDTIFSPADSITKMQMAILLYRFNNYR